MRGSIECRTTSRRSRWGRLSGSEGRDTLENEGAGKSGVPRRLPDGLSNVRALQKAPGRLTLGGTDDLSNREN